MPPSWEQYRVRYNARPETFEAYVDVWTRVAGVRDEFAGWGGFSQAANAEPAQPGDRVRQAEGFMRKGGYVIGPATARGARTWVASEGEPTLATGGRTRRLPQALSIAEHPRKG